MLIENPRQTLASEQNLLLTKDTVLQGKSMPTVCQCKARAADPGEDKWLTWIDFS